LDVFGTRADVCRDEVLLTDVAKAAHREGRLGEIESPDLYLANCEILFHRHPELGRDIDIAFLVGPSSPMRSTSMQLFLGRKGTGTSFHCANIWNLFVMVSGSKRWTLIDPKYSYWMYPRISPNMTYVSSYHTSYQHLDTEACPLMARCPRLEVLLEPGDVLINPPWWWHEIENVTPTTVAVATRWKTSHLQVYNTNFMFDFLQMINPTVFRMMSLIISKTISDWLMRRPASVIVIDEHTHFERASHDIPL
jgi:hypothetical protein